MIGNLSQEHPKLSIITITKNDLSGLRKTRNSILAQIQNEAFEHIVLDGSDESEAGSVHSYLLEQGRDGLTFVSGVDSGIYQAMNLGAEMARGQILMWVNSGDSLHDNNSVSHLLKNIPDDFNGWGFGITAIHDEAGNLKSYAGKAKVVLLDHLVGEAFFPHPSAFFSSSIINKLGPYDEKVGLVADQIYMLSALKVSDPLFVNRIISDFVDNGASSKLPRNLARAQLASGAIKHGLVPQDIRFTWLMRRLVLFLKDIIKSIIFPTKLG